MFHGKISRHCDQYSLAIVYQELLTGTLPFNGKNIRQLLLQHTQDEPDLQPLPARDRAMRGAGAAQRIPEHRFPSCLDFVRALQGGGGRRRTQVAATPMPTSLPTPAARAAETTQVPRGKRQPGKSRLRDAQRCPTGVLDGLSLSRVRRQQPADGGLEAQRPTASKLLVQILYGLGGPERGKLKEALARLQLACSIPPCSRPMMVHVEPGRLVLLDRYCRETLRDRFQQCQARKQPGIPRRTARLPARRRRGARLSLSAAQRAAPEAQPAQSRARQRLAADRGVRLGPDAVAAAARTSPSATRATRPRSCSGPTEPAAATSTAWP